MRQLFCISLLLLIITTTDAQTFTDSNLPIVIINTEINPGTGRPAEIPDEPKIPAIMKIIFRPDGLRNYITDQNNPGFLNYNGRIGIEKGALHHSLFPKNHTDLQP